MNIAKKISAKGFTIIEVVLVLAIGSAIILMVLLALPALQSSQRDSARKNDANLVLTAVNTYMSNNRGSLPANTAVGGSDAAVWPYVSTAVSINTTRVFVQAYSAVITSVNQQVTVVKAATCGTSGATVGQYNLTASTTTTQVAVVTKLESAGGVAYCANN